MKQYKKNLKKYLTGAILFSLVALIQCPLSSWAATAEIDIIHSQDRYPAGGSYPLLFHIRISNPWYIHGTEKSDNGLPTLLSFSESPGIKLNDFSFPLPVMKKFEYSKEPVEVFTGDLMVRVLLVVNKTAPIGRRMIKGSLSCQACSSRSCLPPENIPLSLSLLISPKGESVTPLNRTKFEIKEAPSDFHGLIPGFGAGLWLSLAGVFIGGLFLNLTPCVYPLIPITVSYFGGREGKTGGKTIIHGILYVAGLAFTNSLLGLAAALSGDMLGSILQNPVVLMFVAGVLVALALSFFGFWEFRIPSAMTRLASKNFGGYFGTFFMGMTLGIVAAPCLGPFILGLLTYVGQKGDLFLGFLYFFVLSFS